MMKFAEFMKRATGAFIDARERSIKQRVREQVLAMSDRQLEGFGLSRDQVDRGSTWPWGAPVEAYCAAKAGASQQAGTGTTVANPFDHAETDDKLAA